MRTVLILRHAKSSWTSPGSTDHDRPLNGRGQRDAPRIGMLLNAKDLVPDVILSSTARRARRTAALVAESSGFAGRIESHEVLYLGGPGVFIDLLGGLDGTVERPLVVGHNPGLEQLLEMWTGHVEKLPTGALAQVQLDVGGWADLHLAAPGKLIALWRPAELGPTSAW